MPADSRLTASDTARVGGLYPPLPQAPYFDSASGSWILSRYSDVLAAFRDTRLFPSGSAGEDPGGERDKAGPLLERSAVQEALSAGRVGEWQAKIEARADELLERLPADRPVDLLQEFAMPWCLSMGLMVTGSSTGDGARLSALTDRVFWATGLRRRAFLRRRRAARAVAELQRYFAASQMPRASATFSGTVETLPRLLANAWLALFQHPAEIARLRADPGLMPLAVEELLRYAGIIPRLFRKATTPVELGALRLAVGDRVTLMIASANRDPEQFPDPDRVDVSRAATGQLSLGIGRCSCAGARLVRTAFSVSIAKLLRVFAQVSVTDDAIQWQDDHLCWPRSVPVTLER